MSDFSFGIIVGIVIGAIALLIAVGNNTIPYYEETAIENGCAGHDAVTGEWYWIDRSKIDD